MQPEVTLVGRLNGPVTTTCTPFARKAEAVLLVSRPGLDPQPWPLEAWGDDAQRLAQAQPGQLIGVIGTITTGGPDPGEPSWLLLAQRLELLSSPTAQEA